MNTQNILKYYGSKLDIKLDGSEFYDYELSSIPNDYNTDVLNIDVPIIYTSMTINETSTAFSPYTVTVPRTEKGWTIDLIFNRNGLPWWLGEVFYYLGVINDDNPENYADNNLSFGFTEDGCITWEAIHYSGACDPISGYTESYYIASGQTPQLCSNGLHDNFNISIVFDRYYRYTDCQVLNEGGIYDLITGATLNNDPLNVMTGDTPDYTYTEILNKKWYDERYKRLGVLKIYLNGNPIYSLPNWEEIIPSNRGVTPFMELWGSGTPLMRGIHFGTCYFKIKSIKYYIEPLDFVHVKQLYLSENKPNFNIIECNPDCKPIIIPIFSITPSVTPSNTPSISQTIPIITITPSITPSVTPSNTPSISQTIPISPSATPIISMTPSISITPSITPTISPSSSYTPTYDIILNVNSDVSDVISILDSQSNPIPISVNWGDGSSDVEVYSHTYSSPGTYVVGINVDNISVIDCINIEDSSVTYIDISKIISLTTLYIQDTNITSLDISNQINLTDVDIENNSLLPNVDFSKLSVMSSITLQDNLITTVDISMLTSIPFIYISEPSCSSILLSSYSNTSELQIYNTIITTLDLMNNVFNYGILIENNINLTTISNLVSDLILNQSQYTICSFNNNALSQSTIDYLLGQCASGSTNILPSNTNIYFNGGTNSSPSITGQDYITTLTGLGWIPVTN